jgi:hypothetical protein
MKDYFCSCSLSGIPPNVKIKKDINLDLNKIQMKITFILIFIISISQALYSQSLAFKNDFAGKPSDVLATFFPVNDFDSTSQSVFGNVDSLLGNTEPNLLPENISFMENLLWGKNGVTRKIGLAGTLSPEERESELSVRRTMLTAHQFGGFATLALMLTADYFGQKVIDGNRRAGDTHKTIVAATIVSYSLTGLLAILSPPPLIRRDESSTTTIHKTLAWIHAAGMILTPILGSMIGGRRHFNIDKAHYHQISGYITTAIFASAMIVVTF